MRSQTSTTPSPPKRPLEVVRKGTFLPAPLPEKGGRSVRSLSESGSGSGSESIPILVGAWPAHTSLPSCVCTAIIRFRYPVSPVRIPSHVLSIPRPIPTPDPDLASSLTFSDDLKFGPETYTYTAKRYTF